MNTKRHNRRGLVLIIVIIFLVMTVIMSIGLYSAVSYLFRMQGAAEVERIKGYYTAVGGLRYAYILLKRPEVNLDPSGNAEISLNDPEYAAIAADLGIAAPHNLVIKINKITGGADAGKYNVESTYYF